MIGRVLREGIAPPPPARASSSLLVLDAMRADYFDTYAGVMPTLSRLRREGAWFPNTRINYLPTLTSVGHATIGTGTDPRFHGLAANNLFNRVTQKPQPAYADLDPRRADGPDARRCLEPHHRRRAPSSSARAVPSAPRRGWSAAARAW